MRYLIIISLLGLLSCRNDNEFSFINNDQSQLNETIFAYQTELKGGISFTTTSGWFIDIEDKAQTSNGDDNNSWIKISPMSGSAGDANLTINMEANTTGENRNIKIHINSDGSTITIAVEQKSYRRNIAAVVVNFIDGGNEESVSSREIISFDYDSNRRLTKIQSTKDKDKDKPLAIEYHSDMITETSDSHSLKKGVEAKSILNDKGIVVSGEKLRKETGIDTTYTFPKAYILTYNGDGYLTEKVITTYNSDQPITTTFVWSDNNLTKKTTIESFRSSDDNTNKILFSYADCENMANLDVNVIITGSCHDLLDFPTLIRKTGKSSNNIASKVIDKYEFSSKFWSESTYRFEHELDDDGYIIKVKRYFSFSYDSYPEDKIPEELLDATYIITYNE